MKNLLYILLVLALSGFQFKKTIQIKSGKQVGKLILNSSNVQSAITQYGDIADFTQGISCGEHTYFTNRFSFSKQRITVISETVDNENEKNSLIVKIGLSYPCGAETEEGISLIRDNIDKILTVYGKPEATDTSKASIDIHYNSKGISFRCDRNRKNIQKIEIYSPNLIADFCY
ncbi:hypothetical protein [Ferruginibacter sp.]